MKKTGICLWMMIKRMGKHPIYRMLLLLFPAACFVIPKLNRETEEEQIPVGYVIERLSDNEAGHTRQPKSEEEEYYRQLLDMVACKLSEDTAKEPDISDGTKSGNLFNYIKYTDADELKRAILTGELSCGAIFDAEFAPKLRERDYRHCITLYVPEGMNVGGMVQEDIFQRVYQAYSAVWYAELLAGQGYRLMPGEVLEKFSEYQKEGKVFAVHYEVYDKEDEISAAEAGSGNARVLSLRGILAFLTFMSASLGALDGSRDRKKGMGKGISCPGTLAVTAVGAPILPATLFLAAGMLFGGQNREMISMVKIPFFELKAGWVLLELGSAVLYGLILWLLAFLFGEIVPEKLLEGLMPCFLLLAFLCCPIFVDFGETIPLIGCLSRLFPVTWYLKFWG